MTVFCKNYLSSIIVAFCVLNIIRSVTPEFLFCHNGPQRIRDMDCPGGFVAKQPINITCSFYYMTDTVPEGSIPQMVENHCDSPDPIEMESTGDFVKASTFSEFFVNVVDPAADKAKPGTLTPEDACADSCLADWKDPDEVEREDHLEDKPPPLPDQETAEYREKILTKKVFMGLIMDDNYDEDDPEGLLLNIEDPLFYDTNTTMKRINKLMAKSMQILFSQCKPYVEADFLRQVLKAVMLMNKLNKKGMMEIGIAEYDKIDLHLDQCLSMENKVFKLRGSECETYHKVEEVEYLKKTKKEEKHWRYKIQSRSFVWGMYDPIVEAAWAVVDFIHGYCFGSFITDLNHHHIYEIAMESLFPLSPVQRHWMTPTVLGKGDVFWNSVLETGDIKIAMRNLDACVVAGYAVSPYRHRLERIFTPEKMLDKPVNSTSPGGWTKSIKDYWRYYDAKGGFKRYAKEHGYCLESADEDVKTKTIAEVKSKCPAPSDSNESS